MKIIDNVYVYRPGHGKVNTIGHVKIDDGKIREVNEGRFGERGAHVINGKGRTLSAAFTDSHLHLLRYGLMKKELDLRKAKSWQAFQRSVRNHYDRLEQYGWIVGNGMVDDQFEDLDHVLTAKDLRVFEFDAPMFFLHDDGHQAVVNEKALDLLKNEPELEENHDVFIEKDETGEWTGRFKDTAVHYIKFHFRQRSVEEVQAAVEEAIPHLLKYGITAVHTDDLNFTGSYERVWKAYTNLENQRKLPIHAYLHHYVYNADDLGEFLENWELRSGEGTDRVKVGAVKIFLDGTQRLHTAAMRRPYHDHPETRGTLVYGQEDVDEMVRLADENDMQVTMHAIGDAAVEQALNAIEKVGAERMRHRIIHIQQLEPDLIERLKKIKPYCEIQPGFLMGEYDKKAKWSGEDRARYCDSWGTVYREAIPFTGSSDCPISPLNPFMGIFAAVNRTDENGNPEGGWMPTEKLPLDAIFRAYTETPPYLAFQENNRGKIVEGYDADFLLLSDHPEEVDAFRLKDVQVEETWVAGEKKYDCTRL
ncbi:MAG TPA: amidohydrolase [Bacillales bacterium]|nr:amidohydrolase [Bacillales bacterium]